MTSILVGSRGTPHHGPPPQRGIGVIAPFDFGLDREIWRWVPDDISLHVTRTPWLLAPVTIAMAERVGEPEMVRQATEQLLAVEPGVVAYLCTSGSFVGGLAGERRLRHAIEAAGAPAAVTTAGALLDRLRDLEVDRVAVATPYIESVTERLHVFLTEAGVQVVGSAHLGLLNRIWQVPYRTVVDLVTAADSPDAQAIFVSCTNLATYDLIGHLEERLGKPVLTANQVTLWAAIRALDDVPPPNAEGWAAVDEVVDRTFGPATLGPRAVGSDDRGGRPVLDRTVDL